MTDAEPSIFVSYAHEDADLAAELARAMQDEGARVWLDQGELLIGDSLIERISEAIAEFDFVAALVSYSSVGSNWCQKEIALALSKQMTRGERKVTVLPLRVGEVKMPASLADVKWIALDATNVRDCATKVVRDAKSHRSRLHPTQKAATVRPHSGGFESETNRDLEPVRLVGVDTERIGRPRNDGSRGSALYRVPVLLNRKPDFYWRSSFASVWNRPPAFTTMHRPGIASVDGDRIVLDGTTIEEFEKYHLQTLKLVVAKLNEMTSENERIEADRRERERREEEQHRTSVDETVARLNFDD